MPRRYIFVGGTGRSGTTLLQKMLVAHSQVTGGPEFDHARRIVALWESMTNDFALNKQQFYYNKEELKKKFQDFFDSMFINLLHGGGGVEWISEKTPANIDVVDQLLKLFDSSVFVYVQRDGRDVIASHRQVFARLSAYNPQLAAKQKKDYSIKTIATFWNRNSSTFMAANNDRSIAERLFMVRYEELVSEPAVVLAKLCDFLGLEFQMAMLSPQEIKVEQSGFSESVDSVWYTKKQFEQSINSTSIGRWKTDLSVMEKFWANLLTCRNLSIMEYDVAPIYLRLRYRIKLILGR